MVLLALLSLVAWSQCALGAHAARGAALRRAEGQATADGGASTGGRGAEPLRTIRIRLAPSGEPASFLEREPGRPYVAVSVFSGRRRFEEILLAYLQRLLETRSLDEILLTVTGRATPSDRLWLRGLPDSSANIHLEEVETFGDIFHYLAHDWHPPAGAANDTVVIKCDDDIVYVDLKHFDDFVRYAAARKDMFMVFANVVNNGVAAYYEQQHGSMPRLSRGIDTDIPYPPGGAYGKMFDHPEMAVELHRHFLLHPEQFAWKAEENGGCIVYRPPGGRGRGRQLRFSLNFFAFRYGDAAELARRVADGQGDDEVALTTNTPHTNCMYTDFVVAHYSYGMQRAVIESTDILDWYKKLKDIQLQDESA